MKCLLQSSTFEMLRRLLFWNPWNALESLNFTVLKCNTSQNRLITTILFQKFWHFEMSATRLNFQNAQSLAKSLKRLNFNGTKMFDRMLIWTIKFQKFCNFEMFVIMLKIGDAQSLSYALKRLYFTVLKCFVKNWFDNQISEILTFWNVCHTRLNFRNAQSLAMKRPGKLIFLGT